MRSFTLVGRNASHENFEYLLHGSVTRNDLYRVLSTSVAISNSQLLKDKKTNNEKYEFGTSVNSRSLKKCARTNVTIKLSRR